MSNTCKQFSSRICNYSSCGTSQQRCSSSQRSRLCRRHCVRSVQSQTVDRRIRPFSCHTRRSLVSCLPGINPQVQHTSFGCHWHPLWQTHHPQRQFQNFLHINHTICPRWYQDVCCSVSLPSLYVHCNTNYVQLHSFSRETSLAF